MTHLKNYLRNYWQWIWVYHEISDHYIGIQYIFRNILHITRVLFPWFWIHAFSLNYQQKNKITELYIALKVFILILLLFFHSNLTRTFVLSIYFLCDMVHHLLDRIYHKQMSLRKNFVHLIFNALEIILCYAVMYDYLWLIGSEWVANHSALDMFYFSTVTFATVGYGDMGPINTLGRMLVASQISVSLLFIVIICSSFVSQMDWKK